MAAFALLDGMFGEEPGRTMRLDAIKASDDGKTFSYTAPNGVEMLIAFPADAKMA